MANSDARVNPSLCRTAEDNPPQPNIHSLYVATNLAIVPEGFVDRPDKLNGVPLGVLRVLALALVVNMVTGAELVERLAYLGRV